MTHRKQVFYNIKVMVNIQSPIPTSLYTTELSCEKNAGGGFVYLPSLFFLIISTLFAYFLVCHPYIFYISNVFFLVSVLILSVTMSTAMLPLKTNRD